MAGWHCCVVYRDYCREFFAFVSRGVQWQQRLARPPVHFKHSDLLASLRVPTHCCNSVGARCDLWLLSGEKWSKLPPNSSDVCTSLSFDSHSSHARGLSSCARRKLIHDKRSLPDRPCMENSNCADPIWRIGSFCHRAAFHLPKRSEVSTLTSRGRKARRCRVTFAVFAQFSRFHTMSVCFNF